MTLLLGTFNDVVLPLLVLAAGIGLSVLIFIVMRKKLKAEDVGVRKTDSNDVSVTAINKYCTEEEMKFLDSLHMALPKEFIAFPKVGVDNLVEPGKNRLAYNSIMAKYVDVVVFYRKNMQPVLVVDLVKENVAVSQLRGMDEDVVAVLKSIKMPVVKVKVEKAYNLEALRHQLIHQIPDKILAEINMKQMTK